MRKKYPIIVFLLLNLRVYSTFIAKSNSFLARLKTNLNWEKSYKWAKNQF